MGTRTGRMVSCLALGAILFAGCAQGGGVRVKTEPTGPDFELKARPKFTLMAPSLVRVELRGKNIGEKYYCPEIEWDWDDGSKGSNEPDCPPYEQADPGERDLLEIHNHHVYRGEGNYTIRATLSRAGNKLLVLSDSVRVGSRTDEREDPQQPNNW